jgi:hypothetical protein
MNDDIISGYDAVTAADIADFTHYLAQLRFGQPRADDPAERAVFLARKAELLARIAAQHTRTDPGYAEHVLHLALPTPSRPPSTSRSSGWGQLTGELEPVSAHPVGPDQRRTPGPVPGIWPTFRDRLGPGVSHGQVIALS